MTARVLLIALVFGCNAEPDARKTELDRETPAGLTSANRVGGEWLEQDAGPPPLERGPLALNSAATSEARERAIVELLSAGLPAPLVSAAAPEQQRDWVVRGVLHAHVERLQACKPGLDAALAVDVKLGAAGRVEEVSVSGSAGPEANRCLEQAIRGLQFPDGARSSSVTVVL